MILLDTCAIIWSFSNKSLVSDKAMKAITKAMNDGEAFASSISAWEIAILEKKGRIQLNTSTDRWIESTKKHGVRYIPINNDLAMSSVLLPFDFHQDPADRIIVATARSISAAIVTKDNLIRNCEGVKTIW